MSGARGRAATASRTRPERCPNPNPFNGATCKRRRCAYCGYGWVRSWEVVTRVNLGDYGDRLVLISITAPGKSILPWACDRNHVHSGKRGCQVDRVAANAWSEAAPMQLRRLRDAARLAVRREGLPVESLWLERVWEPQKRGVPHVHVVAGANTPAEYEAAQRFHAHLSRLAPDYGFGMQLHISKMLDSATAARYLSGYLLGRSAHKGTIRDNLGHPRMPSSLIYVARRLTAETLVTMRRLRYAKWYLAALANRVSVYPRLYDDMLLDVARVAVRLERAGAPPDPRRVLFHVRTLLLMRQVALGAM